MWPANHGNSGKLAMGSKARAKFWNMWWWVLMSPGSAIPPRASTTVALDTRGAGPVPTERITPSSANNHAFRRTRRSGSMVTK